VSEFGPRPPDAPRPPAEAYRVLKDVFGFHGFRGEQEAIVGCVSHGGDALVLMPTGGGKSLCYQIPALVREGVAVVISPLIALMQDQVDALAQLGVRAAFLNSSLDFRQARDIEDSLRQGSVDLLYVAPERLLTDRFLGLLENSRLALFAIDEAHCVSQWGHDFRPEYTKLSILHERFPAVPRLALTATADLITREEIREQLRLQDARVFVSGFDRPNIRYRVVEKESGFSQLLHFLREDGKFGEAGIVYCGSRKKVDDTASHLQRLGFKALPYHAKMDAAARREHQQRFLREDGVIMVATIAFGMGIDKPDVRFVAHLDLPQTLEAYYQETGRAGRDGAPAEAWMSYGLGDVVQLRQRIDVSEAGEEHKRLLQQKLNAMLGYCESAVCRRVVLLRYFGENRVEPCGNCDVCLDPPETWDGTIAAQKLLSAAWRTGQRYGSAYLIDVLLGKNTDRIIQNGHDRLPTFGVGRDMTEKEWRSTVRQTVAAGLLHANSAHHGALELTVESRPVLRGERPISFRRMTEKPRAGKERRSAAQVEDRDVDPMLLQALRDCRKKLAAAQNAPAYIIFTDASLREMAARRPQTEEQFRAVNGVGEQKYARYGQTFLEVLRNYVPSASQTAEIRKAAPLAVTAEASLALFVQGKTVEDVAAARGLKPSTIYAHLADAVAARRIELDRVVSLTAAESAEIEEAFAACARTAPGSLGAVHEKLGGRYEYGVLKCFAAARTQPVADDQVL
jgi:ATP-dependent DNA helicase RecQ